MASFCGNELILKDTIKIKYPDSTDGPDSCTTTGNKIYCNYTKTITDQISISLTGAKLPFMGNTEDVSNSQDTTDSLSNEVKMNEYVSWYLNGVMNRAENGSTENTEFNAVNFSGPIQKLYPSALLDAQRIKTVQSAGETNHNQLVACADSNIGLIGDVTGMGTFTLKPCYEGDGKAVTIFDGKVFRLKNQDGSEGWQGDLSWFRSIVNWVTDPIRNAIGAAADLLPQPLENIIDQSTASFWNKRTPPLPWSDENGKPFETELLYRKAYSEWNGKTCLIVPVANWLVCFDNILIPNKYADFWSYVPLSTTEDIPGEIEIINNGKSQTPGTVRGDVIITEANLEGDLSSKLSLPHIAESNELAELLQNTYTPLDQKENQTGNATNISSQTFCNPVEVRSNPGDTIFADSISGKLTYTAKFTCEFEASTPSTTSNVCYALGGRCVAPDWTCINNFGQQDCPSGSVCGNNCVPKQQTCIKNVYVGMSTQGKIQGIDDVWSRLVAGPMAVFKRIYPKTNTEGSVGQIMDIPASTNITYSGSVITEANTDLKIPHVGGVSEYFLKGIQTALRPKGYGEPIVFAGSSTGTTSPINPEGCSIKEVPAGTCDGSVFSKFSPPSQTTFQGSNYFNAYILPNLSSNLLAVYKEAERKTGVPCEILAGIHFREGSNNPNKSLQDGGTLDTCLIDSAIKAGEVLRAVGGASGSWDGLITALARYNGMGNSNCSDPPDTNQVNPPPDYKGPCPPPDGIDHNYVMNFLNPQHLVMYIIYCRDHEICYNPKNGYTQDTRPGALTVAVELYNHK